MTRHPDARPSEHALHEPFLVARAVADDLAPHERDAADALLRDCSECASLAADLRAVSAALATGLPRPTRPRDFRLTPDQVASARGSRLGRAAAALAGPRLRLIQPLGAAALSMGIAVAVLGTMLATPFGGGAGTPDTDRFAGSAAASSPAPAQRQEAAAATTAAAATAAAAETTAAETAAASPAGSGGGDSGPAEGGGSPTHAIDTAGGERPVPTTGALPPGPATPPGAEQGGSTRGPSEPAVSPLAASPAATQVAARDQDPGGGAGATAGDEPTGGALQAAPPSNAPAAPSPAPLLIGLALASIGALLLAAGWLARRLGRDRLLR